MMQLLQPQDCPAAIAHISGGTAAPHIFGSVSFFPHKDGVLVTAEIRGLPDGGPDSPPCDTQIFGFHIHEGADCGGLDFSDTGGHFNPDDCTHPHHAGDLPPLFGCKGRAYLAVLTDRFSIPDVIGRTVVIHSDPDDFTSQPAGHSGTKIACGVIRAI